MSKITRKQRSELKALIARQARFNPDTIRIDARSCVTAKLDPDQITGLTTRQRKYRGFVGHYPEILNQWR